MDGVVPADAHVPVTAVHLVCFPPALEIGVNDGKNNADEKNKIREGKVTKEKRREGTRIRSVYEATSFQAKCIQSAQAQNFPNPFLAVVHGVLQELADVGTAGNAVHGRRT
ncbi:hypothetical protein ALC53_01291 [Atta colombica]|uniref:Uncharacterized protein n=1 Tax=Atta colombica TaxID=520822 RepID=A0A195BW83_9HYME|nr:hypothetical protein ALC53_01291 [Atta colombica]